MKMRFAFAAILLACTAAMPAGAVKIATTLSGSFSGTLNGQAFTDSDGVFTGILDSDDLSGTGTSFILLESFSAVLDGVDYSSLFLSFLFATPDGFGFGGRDTSYILFAPDSSGPVSATALPVTYLPSTNLWDTDRGTMEISDGQDLTFGLVLAGAVPEPATWGMVALGFGLVGAGLRRRPASTATRA